MKAANEPAEASAFDSDEEEKMDVDQESDVTLQKAHSIMVE